jgi:hypothetical protein
MLGTTQRDRITGFTGVCTGVCTYLSGCNQALLAPPIAPDGSARESAWFDLQRLEEYRNAAGETTRPIVLDNAETPGFDRPAPKR